jgi:hypothetical protein
VLNGYKIILGRLFCLSLILLKHLHA